MDIECRALYNSLRMNWLMDPNMPAEPWQVEDYRHMKIEAIFERLKLQEIELDRVSFLALSEEYENPEDLAAHLVLIPDADQRSQDQVYLLVFELWRRLLPEKPTWTIFCDELDYQIQKYDRGQLKNLEAIQDVLANLKVVLDENVDQGGEASSIFEMVCSGCANDIESFLYDFIDEQIDEKNISYAAELLDSFEEYIHDIKWFDFLRLRQLTTTDPEEAAQLLRKIITESLNHLDLVFNLELLSYLAQGGDEKIFVNLMTQTIPLLKSEEDFQDLLMICADFYHFLDLEQIEKKIQGIIDRRSKISLQKQIDLNDPDLADFFKAITH
jgi:hypothetical protein